MSGPACIRLTASFCSLNDTAHPYSFNEGTSRMIPPRSPGCACSSARAFEFEAAARARRSAGGTGFGTSSGPMGYGTRRYSARGRRTGLWGNIRNATRAERCRLAKNVLYWREVPHPEVPDRGDLATLCPSRGGASSGGRAGGDEATGDSCEADVPASRLRFRGAPSPAPAAARPVPSPAGSRRPATAAKRARRPAVTGPVPAAP